MKIFPPRPEVKISPKAIGLYEKGQYYAQVKANGSAVVVVIDEFKCRIFNRYGEFYTKADPNFNFVQLYRGTTGRIVLCGEYLDKNLKGEGSTKFNHKFIIWDILEYEGVSLVGKTFDWRQTLLVRIYETSQSEVQADGSLKRYDFVCPITKNPNCYLATLWLPPESPDPKITFSDLFKLAIQTEVYEGLVFKRAEAKLEPGFNIVNNNGWQVKCRKPTKNYLY